LNLGHRLLHGGDRNFAPILGQRWRAGGYPQIADDYVRRATLRKPPCDVFLAAHGNFYDLEEKCKKLQEGGPNPFIDHAGYLAYIDLKEKQFLCRVRAAKEGCEAVG